MGYEQLWLGVGGGGGDTLPIVDTTAVVKGSVDDTKLVRIEADGLSTATTRVITMPDNDVNLGDIGGSSLSVGKAADETLNDDAVMQNDDDLLFAVEANSEYRMRVFLIWSSDGSADFKLGFSGPSGTTMDWTIAWSSVGNPQTISSTITFNGAGVGNKRIANYTDCVIHTGGTPGTFNVQWAQAFANASDTVVYAGSFITVEKTA